MSKNRYVVPAIAICAVVALAAGGGYYTLSQRGDPLKRGTELEAAGDLRGAVLEFRNAVRTNPDSADAHLRLARVQMQLADPVAAEKEFKAARDLGADKWGVLPSLGEAYMAQGRFKDVLADVPAEGPTPQVTARNLLIRSMAQVGLNDGPAAKASLDAAEKAEPGNASILLAQARLALALRDFTRAEAKVDEALARDPKSTDGLLMKSQVFTAEGNKAGAMTMVEKAVASNPDSAAARLDRANLLLNAGQDEKAREDISAVLAKQPRNAGATYLNAVLLIRAGKNDDAQAELTKLQPVASRFPRALYFQAMVAANLGQTESAVDFATRYVQRAPNDPDAARLLARTELQAGRPERAVEALTKAVDAGQDQPQTLDMLGQAYTALGRPADATAAFKRASAAAPDDAAILTHLASSQMQSGDSMSATSTLERSIELAPKQPNANEALIAAALSAGEIDKAEAALNSLRAREGETEAVGLLTGMVRLGRLDLENARQAFADTAKRFPDSVNAKVNLAKVLLLQGRRPDGETILREVLAKEPANATALDPAVQLLVQEKQFQSAIDLVEAARKAEPKNVGLTATLADLLVRSGDPKRAVTMLETMRSAEALPLPLQVSLARAQEAAGQTREAVATYGEALKAEPGNLQLRQLQVDLLLKSNDIDAARASLQEALRQAPGNFGVMSSMVNLETRTRGNEAGLKLAADLRADTVNLPSSALLQGDALMVAKRYPEALQSFEAEYKREPSEPLALRIANAQASLSNDAGAARVLQSWLDGHPGSADASQLLALLDIRAKRFDDAQKNLEAVLDKRPNDAVAMNNLAWVYQQKKDPRARALAQRAYLQAPTPETADTLAWILVDAGDPKRAVTLLRQSTAQRPNDLAMQYHLGAALNAAGEPQEAVATLQPLIGGADFPEKPAARALLDTLNRLKK